MYRSSRMNWVRAITGVLILWSSTAWGATLTWDANSESDLAGYRVYRCGELPCTQKSGASLLATVGKNEARLNIGTPTTTQYYFVTAYDFAQNESVASKVVVFKPAPATTDSRMPAHQFSETIPVRD
jgi:fibronectin type 3 domain-containing protein